MEKNSYTFEIFKKPPVTEVALSVQFRPIRQLRTQHIIERLWPLFKEKDFTKIEDKPPLTWAFEIFDDAIPPPTMEISNLPPVPRYWFLNDDETQLVQIQQDRFAHNWRRHSFDTPYPQYSPIRENFERDYNLLKRFIVEVNLGEIVSDLCEITYVNTIPFENDWMSIEDIHKIICILKQGYTEPFLPDMEDINLRVKYRIEDDNKQPIGRFYISVDQGYSKENTRCLFLKLTARGKPIGDDLKGVLSFLDIGHEWIVKGFTSITTDKMHTYWGRRT